MEDERNNEIMEIEESSPIFKVKYPYKTNNITKEDIGGCKTNKSVLRLSSKKETSNSLSELNSSLATNYSNNSKNTGESINQSSDSLNDTNIKKNSYKKIKSLFKFESSNLNNLSEYYDEIYLNLLLDEHYDKNLIKIDYMNQQNDINDKMRAILVDWIIEVHYRYRFKRKTLLQTIMIIDLYLSKKPISKINFQLLGIASLFISCKENEMYYPGAKEFINMTNNAYTKRELLSMEAYVLNVLNFQILSSSADEFYNILSKCFDFNKEQKLLGEYFMDSSLIIYSMLKYRPSIIAMACAYIVMKFYGIKKYKDLYSSNILMKDSQEKEIKECARELCFLVKNLSNSSLKATKEKYSSEKFGKVAYLCEEKK
jgi:cyclin B